MSFVAERFIGRRVYVDGPLHIVTVERDSAGETSLEIYGCGRLSSHDTKEVYETLKQSYGEQDA